MDFKRNPKKTPTEQLDKAEALMIKYFDLKKQLGK